jgi:hypothetical protein
MKTKVILGVWMSAAVGLFAGSGTVAAQSGSATQPANPHNCRERRYALSPTEADRLATERARLMLQRGEMPAELQGLSFQRLNDIRNGRSTLMAIYIVDFLHRPDDVVEFTIDGRFYRWTKADKTAVQNIEVQPGDPPVQLTVRSDFWPCKAW